MTISAEQTNKQLLQSLGIVSATVVGSNDASNILKTKLTKVLGIALIGIAATTASLATSAENQPDNWRTMTLADIDKMNMELPPSRAEVAKQAATEIAFGKETSARAGKFAGGVGAVVSPQRALLSKGISALVGGAVAGATGDKKLSKRTASIAGSVAVIATAGPLIAGIEAVAQGIHIYEDVKKYKRKSALKDRISAVVEARRLKDIHANRMELKTSVIALDLYMRERERLKAMPEPDRQYRYDIKLQMAIQGHETESMAEHIRDALEHEEFIESEGGTPEPWVLSFREYLEKQAAQMESDALPSDYEDYGDFVGQSPSQQLRAGVEAFASWAPAPERKTTSLSLK